jgi:protein-disulfide isomerase
MKNRNHCPPAILLIGGLLAFQASHAVQAEEPVFGDREQEAIQQIIEDHLINNPDVIVRALESLRRKQEVEAVAKVKDTIASNESALADDANSPFAGNEAADVAVVEFFDYRCPYCKKVAGDVDRLFEADDDLKVVYKEWPILGLESVVAARAALAARTQDSYLPFHRKVMAMREVTEASVMAAAEELGLNMDQLKKDMNAPEVEEHLKDTMRLSRELGIEGTPAFVIGDELVPGAATFEQLQTLVAKAREGS